MDFRSHVAVARSNPRACVKVSDSVLDRSFTRSAPSARQAETKWSSDLNTPSISTKDGNVVLDLDFSLRHSGRADSLALPLSGANRALRLNPSEALAYEQEVAVAFPATYQRATRAPYSLRRYNREHVGPIEHHLHNGR